MPRRGRFGITPNGYSVPIIPYNSGNSVRLRIVDNGVTNGEVAADRLWDDVSQAAIGTGDNGFSLTVPDGLSPWTAHTIEVRYGMDGASPWLFREAMAAVA
jgi:hypothetical protein